MLNPMKLKDYVTMGNILGGLAAMIAAVEGSLDWACGFMLIAWIFDSFDGAVARMTGTGSRRRARTASSPTSSGRLASE